MGYQVRVKQEEDFLFVRLSGDLRGKDLTVSEDVFLPLAEACVKHQCRKALLDIRRLTLELAISERFEIGSHMNSIREHGIKLALVAREEQMMSDRFFETVAQNRGIHLKVFTELDEAIVWL